MNDKELNQMLEEYNERQLNRLLGLEPTDNSNAVDNRQRNIEINKRWINDNIFEHPQINPYYHMIKPISNTLNISGKGFKEEIEEHFGKTEQQKLIDLI